MTRRPSPRPSLLGMIIYSLYGSDEECLKSVTAEEVSAPKSAQLEQSGTATLENSNLVALANEIETASIIESYAEPLQDVYVTVHIIYSSL